MFVKIILLLSTASIYVQSKELPGFLADLRCSLTNDFRNCFIKNGNKVIPEISKGLPDFHLPKMNPLEIPFLQLVSTPSLHLNLTNLKVYGLDDMKITDVSLFKEYGGITVTLKGKNVTIDGEYIVDGQILVLPIKGSGHFSLSLKDGTYKGAITARAYDKNGQKYFESTGEQFDYHFEKIIFNLQNLFDGNKQLSDEMNKFLNENWDKLLGDFGPGIAKTISVMFRKIFDEFNSELAIYEIFLE